MKLGYKLGFALALAVPTAIAGISSYIAYSMTRVERIPVNDNPARLDLNYEDISFPAAVDGLMLKGWYIRADNSNRCIIMVHGKEQHRADPNIGTLEIAKGLIECGYNVLMFDLRGHGQSEDSRMSGGYFERRDVRGAINFVRGLGIDPERIGIIGFSMGAVASLLAAADDKTLPAIIVDSCYAEMKDLIDRLIAKHRYLPEYLVPIVMSITKKVYGIDFLAVQPLMAMRNIYPRPVYFIHGEFDNSVPVEHALRLYHSSGNPRSSLWIVPEAEHVQAYKTRPDEYINRVVTFFNQNLKITGDLQAT